MTETIVIPKKTINLIEPKQNRIVDKEKFNQKRVAAYCRVSTDSEEQLTSYKTQKKVYTEMIAANKNWEFAGLYADEGISGTRADKRPEFNKMINACLKGKIDYIITKSVSRFARNTVECLQYVRMLKEKKIGIIFEEQNIDTLKCNSELYLVIYAGFAQSESESISKNITWACRKNFENGKVQFNYSQMLGYKRGKDDKPEIVPEEAAIVKEIFKKFLAGETLNKIADDMCARGYHFRGKKLKFNHTKIKYILTNERYTGDAILQKTVTVDCISKTRKKNQGEAPMYLVQNNHPAIISHEMFNKAQEESMKRKNITPQSKKTSSTYTGKYSKYALSQVMKCGECGSRYKRCTWVRNSYKKIVWRCTSRLDYGNKYCHNSPTIEEKDLHAAIVRALQKFSVEDNETYMTLMKATIGEALGFTGGSDEVILLKRRIDTLNKKMMDLVSSNAQSGGDFESCESEFKEISSQIDQLKSRMETIQKVNCSDSDYNNKLSEIQRIIDKRETNIGTYDNSIVHQMIECIKVYSDGRLEIYFGGDYMIEEHI